MSSDAPAAEVAPVADSGISTETHKQVKDENSALREQLATLKAKQQVHDDRQRETLAGMKSEVQSFVGDIVSSNTQYPELSMMQRWAGDFEKSESLDTNLGIARMISCASANFKRVREEASQLTEKSTALADAYKKIEALEGERDSKSTRVTELEGLLNERTDAAQKLQDELAKHGAIKEKFDFSNPQSRETNGASEAAGSSSRSAPAPNMDDALFAFVSGGGRGGLKIGQSSTQHHFLGATGGEASDIAAAMRF